MILSKFRYQVKTYLITKKVSSSCELFKILNCFYSRLETLITTSSKIPGLLFRRNLVGFFIDDINPNSVFLIIFYVMLCHCCYDLSAIQIEWIVNCIFLCKSTPYSYLHPTIHFCSYKPLGMPNSWLMVSILILLIIGTIEHLNGKSWSTYRTNAE